MSAPASESIDYSPNVVIRDQTSANTSASDPSDQIVTLAGQQINVCLINFLFKPCSNGIVLYTCSFLSIYFRKNCTVRICLISSTRQYSKTGRYLWTPFFNYNNFNLKANKRETTHRSWESGLIKVGFVTFFFFCFSFFSCFLYSCFCQKIASFLHNSNKFFGSGGLF